MSAEYKQKRYFRLKDGAGNVQTFSSTADANTKIGFKSVYSTSSPTKTEVLADSDQTLVATYEFDSDSDQIAFKSAIDGEWGEGDNSTPFTPATDGDLVEHFKTEWLHADGSVSDTANLI